MTHRADHARPIAVVAGGGDDQGAGTERALADLVEDARRRGSDLGRGAERHRHDCAAVDERPLNAGEDAAIRPAALVAQHLAGEDLGSSGYAVAGQALRRRRPTARADAVGAVTVAILHRLTGNEALRPDHARGEVRVLEVQASIQDRDPDAPSGPARRPDTRDLETPGELGLIQRRQRFRDRLRHAVRGLAQQSGDQLVHRIAVAAQILNRPASDTQGPAPG